MSSSASKAALKILDYEQPVPLAEERRTPIWRIILVAVTLLVSSVILAEGTLAFYERFVWQQRLNTMLLDWFSRLEPAPGEMYRHVPGEEESWGYRINSMGFRGGEFPPKDPETPRILALGDSVTFGWLLDEHQSWPAMAEERLSRKMQTDVEVLNLGRTATSSLGTRVDVERFGDKLKPDALVISVGWFNDFQAVYDWPDLTEKDIAEGGYFDDRLSEANTWLIHSRLYRLYKHYEHSNAMSEAYVNDMAYKKAGGYDYDAIDEPRRVPYDEFRKNLKFFCEWGNERGIPVFFTTPIMRPSKEQEQPIIRRYAEAIQETPKWGGIVIPSREVLADYASNHDHDQVWIPFDDVHLTEEGTGVLAETISKTVREHWDQVAD